MARHGFFVAFEDVIWKSLLSFIFLPMQYYDFEVPL